MPFNASSNFFAISSASTDDCRNFDSANAAKLKTAATAKPFGPNIVAICEPASMMRVPESAVSEPVRAIDCPTAANPIAAFVARSPAILVPSPAVCIARPVVVTCDVVTFICVATALASFFNRLSAASTTAAPSSFTSISTLKTRIAYSFSLAFATACAIR